MLRDDVLYLALPPAIVAVPNTVLPSMNVTVPVGLVVGDVTVAVNFTFCPVLEGFGDDASVVVEVA